MRPRKITMRCYQRAKTQLQTCTETVGIFATDIEGQVTNFSICWTTLREILRDKYRLAADKHKRFLRPRHPIVTALILRS